MDIVIVRMCMTKFIGFTNTRPSRVSATHLTTRVRKVVPWDHALGILENHARAAALVLGGEPEFATSMDGGGYVMGRRPGGN